MGFFLLVDWLKTSERKGLYRLLDALTTYFLSDLTFQLTFHLQSNSFLSHLESFERSKLLFNLLLPHIWPQSPTRPWSCSALANSRGVSSSKNSGRWNQFLFFLFLTSTSCDLVYTSFSSLSTSNTEQPWTQLTFLSYPSFQCNNQFSHY